MGAILRNSFDWLVDYAIDSKLTQVLTCMRIVHLCKLLEGTVKSMFDFFGYTKVDIVI